MNATAAAQHNAPAVGIDDTPALPDAPPNNDGTRDRLVIQFSLS